MKKTKILSLVAGGAALAAVAVFVIAADHIDAPNVALTSSDIADFYGFEGANPDNTVLIATVQGPLTAGAGTSGAQFDENVLIEFNIDNDGDFVEDLVIQAIRRGSKMYFFGPVAPSQTGLNSTIETSAEFQANVDISSATGSPIQASANGMTFFAGPRRDAFFFDFNQFNLVAQGPDFAPTGFLAPAQADDFFDATNVLAVVIEVPNALLGTAPAHVGGAVGLTGYPNAYNCWVSTKRK
jgi:hypothetical protein